MLNAIDLFTNQSTSKLFLLSLPNLHKFLADKDDEIIYCERKFSKGEIIEEKILRIFKNKTNITFSEFSIKLLNMNVKNESNYNNFCDYVRSKVILPYYYRVTGYPKKKLI